MNTTNFKIKTEYIHLIQLLKACNIAESGSQAKMFVDDGIVKVNGENESRKRAKLRIGDIVEIEELNTKIIIE